MSRVAAPAVARRRRRVISRIEVLELRQMMSTTNWVGASGGDWATAANWSNGVPTSADDAVIPANISVTVSTAGQAAQTLSAGAGDTVTVSGGLALGGLLSLGSGATLSVTSAGKMTLGGGASIVAPASGASIANAGTVHWTGGTISGAGATVSSTGTLYLDTAAGNTVDGATLQNTGFLFHTAGDLVLNNGARLVNQGATALYNIQVTGNMSFTSAAGGGTVVNSGIIIRTATNVATVTFAVPISNASTGVLSTTAGSMNLSAGGRLDGGQLVTSPTSTIDLTAGGSTMTVSGTVSGTGNGRIQVFGGTLAIDGNAAFKMQGTVFRWSAGTITGGTLTNLAQFNMNGNPMNLGAGASIVNQGTIVMTGVLKMGNGSSFVNDVFRASTTDAATGSTTFAGNPAGFIDLFASMNIEPASGAAATMTNAGLIEHSDGATLAGTISVPFTNQATGSFFITEGSVVMDNDATFLGGALTVAATGTFDLTGGHTTTISGTISGTGATATTGTATGTGVVALSSGTLRVGAGAAVNFGGTLFQWTGGTIDGGNTLTNLGTINVPTIGDLNSGTTLANAGTGTVSVTGQLRVSNGSTLSNSGVLALASGSSVTSLGGGATLANSGTVAKSAAAGTATVSIAYNSAPDSITEADGGTLTFNGGGVSTGGGFLVAAGAVVDPTGGASVTWSGTYTGSGTGVVSFGSGTLVAGDGLTLNLPAGLLQWTGGTWTGGTITNTGSVTLAGAAEDLGGGVLVNNGTMSITTGTLRLGGGARLQNAATGTVAANGTLAFATSTGGGTIVNAGLFSASGVVTVNAPLNMTPTGTVEADSGTLVLAGGGNSTGGTLVANGTAILDLTGGNDTTLGGTYGGSGAGTVSFSSGRILPGANLTFDLPAGLFQWTGGQISGGVATNAGFMTLSGGSEELAGGASFANSGTLAVASTRFALSDGNLTNLASGTVAMSGFAYIDLATGGATNVMVNDGLLSSTGNPNVVADFRGGGTVEVDSGTLTFNGAVAQVTGSTLTAGTWIVGAGAQLVTQQVGAITTNAGAITLAGANATWTNIAGLATNTGTFSLTGGASFATAGDLTNGGDLVLSGSSLTVNGTYAQSGTYTVQLTSSGFPTFNATAFSLGGTLTGSSANGFLPPPDQTFTLLDNTGAAAMNGTFGGLGQGASLVLGGHHYVLSYVGGTGNDATLTVGRPVANLTVADAGNGTHAQGSIFAVNLTISNVGTDFFTAGSATLYISSSPNFDSSAIALGTVNVSALDVGQSGTFTPSYTLPAQLGAGAYYVIARFDPTSNGTGLATAASSAITITRSKQDIHVGGLDPRFGSAGTVATTISGTAFTVAASASQADGKVVVAGMSAAGNLVLVRFNADGTQDATFGTSGLTEQALTGLSSVGDVLVDASGNILVAATVSNSVAVARFTSAGVIDGSFGSGGVVTKNVGTITGGSATTDAATSLALAPGGGIYVAGSTKGSGSSDAVLLRLTAAGALDTSFAAVGYVQLDFGGGDDVANAVAVQANGLVVIAGSATINGSTVMAAARFTTAGTLDAKFGAKGKFLLAAAGYDAAYGIAIQGNGAIVLAGVHADDANSSVVEAVRLTSAGKLDGKFGAKGVARLSAGTTYAVGNEVSIAPQTGAIMIAARTASSVNDGLNGQMGEAVVRFTSAGRTDAGWNRTGVLTVAAPESVNTTSAATGGSFASLVGSAGGTVAVSPTTGQILAPVAFESLQGSGSSTVVTVASIVPDGADLTTTSITLGAIKGTVVGTVTKGTATIVIQNAGTVSLTAKTIPVTLGLSSDSAGGNVIAAATGKTGGTLKPGATKKVTVKFVFPTVTTGSYYLVGEAPSPAGVSDVNPTNNFAVSSGPTAVAPPRVDIGVSFAAPPSGLAVGKKGKVTLLLTNNGNVPAKGSDAISLFSAATNALTGSEAAIASLTKNITIQPGKTSKLTLALTPPTGSDANGFLGATVTFSGTPADADLTNNTVFSAVQIAAA